MYLLWDISHVTLEAEKGEDGLEYVSSTEG